MHKELHLKSGEMLTFEQDENGGTYVVALWDREGDNRWFKDRLTLDAANLEWDRWSTY